MTDIELEAFRSKWVDIEEIDNEDGSVLDFTFKNCSISIKHAGRYQLTLGNQGFDTNSFGDKTTDDLDRHVSRFWQYVTSPDVNYYDGEFKSESRTAYDVALFFEAMSDTEAFNTIDDVMETLFDALKDRAWETVRNCERTDNVKLNPDGGISIDAYETAGIICDISFMPV